MGFRLKSGNRTSFKNMGGTDKAPAKHYVDDVPDHNDGHSDDLQTPEEHEAAKSPDRAKKAFGEATTEGKESPAKQTATHFADGTKKSPRQIEEQKIHPDEYWYKINGKPATKAEYIKYQNKPGGDEPGKQTNDPTVSLAKQSADKRIKLNK